MGRKAVMFPATGILSLLIWAAVATTVAWIASLYGTEAVPDRYELYLRLSYAALPVGATIGAIGLAQERGVRRFGMLGVMLNLATFVFCFLPWQQWTAG